MYAVSRSWLKHVLRISIGVCVRVRVRLISIKNIPNIVIFLEEAV